MDFLTSNGWQKDWLPDQAKKREESQERSVLVNNTKPVIVSTVSLRSSTRRQSKAQSNLDKNSSEKKGSDSKVNNVLSEYIEAFCAQHEKEQEEQEKPSTPPPAPRATTPPPPEQKSTTRTSVIKFSASTRTAKKTKQQDDIICAKLAKKPTNRRRTTKDRLLKGALGRFEFFDERAMKCYDAYGRINMGAKEDHGPVDWDALLDIAIEEYGPKDQDLDKDNKTEQ